MKNAFLVAGVIAVTSSAHAQSPQIVGQLQTIARSYAAGQGPASPVFAGFGQQGQEVPFIANLQAGRCYTIVGTVGQPAQQLSIYLFDPSGKHVAKDTTDRTITPHVTYCPAWAGPYKIIGKVKRGAGELAIQVFAPGAAPAPPPQYAPPPPQYAPPPPQYAPPPQAYAPPPPQQSPFAGQLAGLARSYAPGTGPATPVFCGVGQQNQEVPFVAQLDAGRCYTFIGAIAPPAEQLSIYLFDPSGKTVAKDTTDRALTPHLTYCTKWAGPHKILGKIKRGAGQLAIQGFAPGGAPPPAAPLPPINDNEE
jgi:hypothetical protein